MCKYTRSTCELSTPGPCVIVSTPDPCQCECQYHGPTCEYTKPTCKYSWFMSVSVQWAHECVGVRTPDPRVTISTLNPFQCKYSIPTCNYMYITSTFVSMCLTVGKVDQYYLFSYSCWQSTPIAFLLQLLAKYTSSFSLSAVGKVHQ